MTILPVPIDTKIEKQFLSVIVLPFLLMCLAYIDPFPGRADAAASTL
jgi:hypothetical protein